VEFQNVYQTPLLEDVLVRVRCTSLWFCERLGPYLMTVDVKAE